MPVIKDRSDPPFVRALTAGGLYFLIALAFGFVLGALRETLAAPRLGSDLAIVLETPLMAGVAWLAAGFSVRRCEVPGRIALRLSMALLALALLIGVEELLTRALRGVSLLDHWRTFGRLAAVANLAGLLWFTLAPSLVAAPRGSDTHA